MYETNIGQYPKQSMYIEKIEPKVSSSLKNPYNLNHKSKVYIMELKVKQSSYAPIWILSQTIVSQYNHIN